MQSTNAIHRTARDDQDIAVRARRRPPHALPVPARLHDTPPFHHDAAVLDAIEKHDGALKAAAALFDRVENAYWVLAGVLYEIDATKAYKDAGCHDFRDYAEKVLGIGYQKARHLLQIYRTFRGLDIDHERLARIGWTKVRAIGHLVANNDDLRDHMDEIMAYAEAHSRAETTDHIERTYIAASKERLTQIKFVVRATGSAADVIDRAIEHAKRQMDGAASNSVAIEWICGNWSNDTEGIELCLEEYVGILFRRFGEEAVVAYFRERSRTENYTRV